VDQHVINRIDPRRTLPPAGVRLGVRPPACCGSPCPGRRTAVPQGQASNQGGVIAVALSGFMRAHEASHWTV
jgi:hypothetical protein